MNREYPNARPRAARRAPCWLLCLLFPAGAAAVSASEPREVLGPGDSIRVSVYQNPDLTTETRVSEQGLVVLPLLGEVRIGGLTPIAAGERIAGRLRQGRFLVDPQVTVTVLDVRSRQVSVLGHVTRPGQYALEAGRRRLIDILAMAGGITNSGDSRVVVMVTGNGAPERQTVDVARMFASGDLSGNLELSAGDSIFVPGAAEFFVYGEVRQAGSYRLRPETSVLDALSLGGGLSPRGTDRGIRIHRQMPDGSVRVIKAELTDRVMANDVVHVGESLF